MMRPLLAAVALLAPVMPASAQDRQQDAPREVREAREIAALGACLVSGNYGLDELLAHVPGSGYSPLPVLRESRCWQPARFHAPAGQAIRGAVAERLLLRDYPHPGAAPRRAPVRLFAPLGADELASASPYARRIHVGLAFGGCVVRAAPDAVYALFRAAVGSAAEEAAFAALAPAMASCVPQGESFQAEVRQLRPFFAEAAYRAAALSQAAAAD